MLIKTNIQKAENNEEDFTILGCNHDISETFEEDIVHEEEKLEENFAETEQSLMKFRDILLIKQFENLQNEKYEMFKSLFVTYISDQLDFVKKDVSRFSELNESELKSKKTRKKIINKNKEQMLKLFKEDNLYLCKQLKNHGATLFAYEANLLIKCLINKPISKDEIEEFREQWEDKIKKVQYMHLKDKSHFMYWDPEAINHDFHSVLRYFQIFLYSQDLKTALQEKKLET